MESMEVIEWCTTYMSIRRSQREGLSDDDKYHRLYIERTHNLANTTQEPDINLFIVSLAPHHAIPAFVDCMEYPLRARLLLHHPIINLLIESRAGPHAPRACEEHGKLKTGSKRLKQAKLSR